MAQLDIMASLGTPQELCWHFRIKCEPFKNAMRDQSWYGIDAEGLGTLVSHPSAVSCETVLAMLWPDPHFSILNGLHSVLESWGHPQLCIPIVFILQVVDKSIHSYQQSKKPHDYNVPIQASTGSNITVNIKYINITLWIPRLHLTVTDFLTSFI